MKKFVFAVLLGLAVVALGVTGIGYLLPQDHVASREAVFSTPAGPVFAAISDVARYPEWRQGLTSAVTPSRSRSSTRNRMSDFTCGSPTPNCRSAARGRTS